MTLWTPNRKVLEPVPLCPRCGGYKRRVADRRDFNRYVSMHWVCCCGEFTCPSSIKLTFYSLSAYASCQTFVPADGSWKVTTLTGANGSRTIPYDDESIGFYGTTCIFTQSYAAGVDGAQVDYDYWNSPTTNCSGTKSGDNTYDEVTIVCRLFHSGTQASARVRQVNMYFTDTGQVGPEHMFQFDDSYPYTYGLGDSVPNTAPHNYYIASNTGTCEVELV